jgi:phenylpyruvate tautomerase PptA (4-oxalocrotonate tautomerase family)
MPRATVRCTESQTTTRQELIAKVLHKTSDILQTQDRVLVVYGRKTANIYYEGAPVPAKSRIT